MKTYLIGFLTILLFSINLNASEYMTWKGKQYHYLLGDFNGDRYPDLLLQSLIQNEPSTIVIGKDIDGTIQYLLENAISLPIEINGYQWFEEKAKIVVIDHNGDNVSDLFIVLHEQQLALVVNGDLAEIDFSNVFNYTADKLEWLKNSQEFAFYVGDFNGDKSQDMFAVTQKGKNHYLMHAGKSNLSVVQKIKKSIRWAKKSEFKIKTGDFNNDGRADIFALANSKNQKHYITYANESGLIGKTETVKGKLKGKDWNALGYSVITAFVDDDENLDLIRLNNMPGGVDENGEKILSDDEDVDDLSDDCDQLYYSAATQTESKTCLPWKDDSSKSSNSDIVDFTKAYTTSAAPICEEWRMDCVDLTPPGPTKTPSIKDGNYHPVGSSAVAYTTSVFNASHYKLYTSTDNATYTYVATYTGTSQSFSVRGNYGYQYIKYQACNYEGCSGLSPYRRIYAYTIPGKPSSLSSSDYLPLINTSFDLTFGSAGGSVDGAIYYLQESYNGGGYSTVCTKTRATWRETSYTCPISGKSKAGIYKYRVYVCNPKNVGCGGSRYSSNVTVSLPLPGVPSLTVPSTDSDGTYNVSWSSVSYATRYELVGEAKGTIYSGSGLSNKRTNAPGTYSYKVRACNSSGCGDYSSVKSISVLSPIPGVPSLNVPSSDSDGTYNVSWSSVSYATRYELVGEAKGTIYSGSGLSNKRTNPTGTYSYKVRACNSSGCGDYSSVKSISVLPPIPGVPSLNVPSSDSDGTYTVSWSSVSDATSYELFEGSTRIYVGSSLSKTITKPNGTYSYKVRACISSGCGKFSPIKSIVVDIPPKNSPPTISGAPSTNINVTNGYNFTPTASDSDNDTLTFSISSKPNWASFEATTGTLSGTPTIEDIGLYENIIISVSDGKIATPVSLPAFAIEVLSGAPLRKVLFIHTDVLGTPVAETDENGDIQ
ncbi:FG-GAP-like repeat-containing protein [Thalassotalea ganghwensis]